MSASAIAGTAIAAALMGQMLKKTNPELGGALTIGAGVLFFGCVITAVSPVLMEVEGLLKNAGAASPWIAILMKCMGTCLIVQFAADCCRDAGESALAGRVEFAGKAAVAVLSMPMFREILRLAVQMLA